MRDNLEIWQKCRIFILQTTINDNGPDNQSSESHRNPVSSKAGICNSRNYNHLPASRFGVAGWGHCYYWTGHRVLERKQETLASCVEAIHFLGTVFYIAIYCWGYLRWP